MLSRTAESLYWAARYMERAETMARLLNAGYRLALLPSPEPGGHYNEWASILAAAGAADGFDQKFDRPPRQRDAETWLVFDRDNPSSVASCIAQARQNMRAMRTAISTEMWEGVNGAYLEFKDLERLPRSRAELPRLTDWTLRSCARLRGAMEATLLRNDGYDFLNLGYYVERADNTARLLDVKYYVLLPTIDMVGGGVDTLQWATLLRSVSALKAFHWAYGGETTPRKVAHFLILNATCPRSLHHCVAEAEWHLTRLRRAYQRAGPAHDRVAHMLAELAEEDIEAIISGGLHEFVSRFIGNIGALSTDIADTYLFGPH